MNVNNSDMWAYDPFSNYDGNGYQSFSRPCLETAFYRDVDFNDTFTHSGMSFASSPQHMLHLTPYKVPSSAPGAYHPSSTRLLVPSFEHQHCTTKSQLTPGTMSYHSLSQSPTCGVNYPIFHSNGLSPNTTSPPLSLVSSPDQYHPQPFWRAGLSLPASEDRKVQSIEQDDAQDGECYDRPYAQLIYDALMQAPGHRMLLRDIYDWFIRNTKKPRESGTNGWQNSIRHNLSMNQAFENDKHDPAASRGARKANSVWVLTDNAVKHGVQSTTRFRKSNASKKGNRGRAPAQQRQRSGARGGQAARRAAQKKQTQEGVHEERPFQTNLASSPLFVCNREIPKNVSDNWSTYDNYSPITPKPGQFFDSQYTLPTRSHFENMEIASSKYEAESYFDEESQLRQLLSQEMQEDNLEHLVLM